MNTKCQFYYPHTKILKNVWANWMFVAALFIRNIYQLTALLESMYKISIVIVLEYH